MDSYNSDDNKKNNDFQRSFQMKKMNYIIDTLMVSGKIDSGKYK